jgi:hypothetical protein
MAEFDKDEGYIVQLPKGEGDQYELKFHDVGFLESG